jgi:Cytochrome c7 and related cytochrome c/Class III cytochrome C family
LSLPEGGLKRWFRFAVVIGAGCLAWLVVEHALPAHGQATSPSDYQSSTGVFTTAHPTVTAAIEEFFNYRPEPTQPIAFTHKVHLANGLQCVNCHIGVDQGPDARIPSVNFCMTCHRVIATRNPEIQKLAGYMTRGEDVPWQRVYGFEPSAHVKFNHAPHIRAGVQCAECHGDMTKQTVAVRAVNLNMGFCVQCHRQRDVSVDCVTCHF